MSCIEEEYKTITPEELNTIALIKNGEFEFNKMMNEIEKIDWRKNLRLSIKKYHLQKEKLETLTPKGVRSCYSNLVKKYYKQKGEHQRINWLQGQLKIFIWLLVLSEKIFFLELQQYTENIVSNIGVIFFKLHKPVCYYQFKLLITQKFDDKWNESQSSLLQKLAKKYNFEGSWTVISKELFLESEGKYLRPAHCCREMWRNHLDVRLVKGNWTKEQDYTIIKQRGINGKKWSQISKIFGPSRTEHMIKNRFNTILRKFSVGTKQNQDQQFDICKEIEVKLFLELNSKIATNINETTAMDETKQVKIQSTSKQTYILQPHYLSYFDFIVEPIPNQTLIHQTPYTNFTSSSSFLLSQSSMINNEIDIKNNQPNEDVFFRGNFDELNPTLIQVQLWRSPSLNLLQEGGMNFLN